MTSNEKRNMPRVMADFAAELYEPDGQTLIGIAHVLDLSISGACIESTRPMEEKSRVVVRLLLGKRHLLTLPAEVIWLKPLPHTREYGLRFGHYPAAVRELITKFVNEYFQRQEYQDNLAFPPKK